MQNRYATLADQIYGIRKFIVQAYNPKVNPTFIDWVSTYINTYGKEINALSESLKISVQENTNEIMKEFIDILSAPNLKREQIENFLNNQKALALSTWLEKNVTKLKTLNAKWEIYSVRDRNNLAKSKATERIERKAKNQKVPHQQYTPPTPKLSPDTSLEDSLTSLYTALFSIKHKDADLNSLRINIRGKALSCTGLLESDPTKASDELLDLIKLLQNYKTQTEKVESIANLIDLDYLIKQLSLHKTQLKLK